MSELVLFLVLGVMLFFVFVLLALRGRAKATDSEAMAALHQIVDLRGLSFRHASLLTDRADYDRLRSRSDLHRLAGQFRRDRRRLVLLWLSLLQQDVIVLWRFRRFLARNGIEASLGEEISIAATAAQALLMLSAARALVVLAGPFVIGAPLRNARHQVERVSGLCGALLRKLPGSNWRDLQQTWVREMS